MNQKQSGTSLNSTQLHLLEMFSFTRQKENLIELKAILFEYYRKKVDEEAVSLWEKYELDDNKINEMLYSHKRTSYK